MTERSWRASWMKQCDATDAIKARYRLETAFDHVVDEKLLKYVQVASQRTDFAWELPRFLSRVRS